MKKIVLSLASAAALSSMSFAGGELTDTVEPVIAVPAVAEDASSFYLGAGFAAVSTRDATSDLSFFEEEEGQDRLFNLTLLAGYDFNQYIAAEGRYTTSVADEDLVEMSGWSLFAKPQYTFDNSNFQIYALLGFGGVTIEGIKGSFVDVDDTGFQWGFGAAYSFGEYMENNNLAVFIDYTSLATEMEGIYVDGVLETDADALTVGLTYKF
ncbi:MAG: porin family protein [Campylobacterota bacterium]|nr:porin family protein [Campylobacterota bacterium]